MKKFKTGFAPRKPQISALRFRNRYIPRNITATTAMVQKISGRKFGFTQGAPSPYELGISFPLASNADKLLTPS